MDESRAQAYANLIQQLLSCPNGEEPQILQDNSELLDAGFLQVCEVTADNFAGEGQENAADFLRNLASQLGQFLGMNNQEDSDNSAGENPREYLEFIIELLQAEAESNSDVKVIYPILRQRQHLLNARFAETLQQVAENLIADKDAETIASILRDIGNLSIDINQFPLGSRANNIEIAIAGYQIVLSHRQPGSEKWAATQNNLAIAYKNKITGNRAENIDTAIACYELALAVYTREDFPEKWAGQNNLELAYRNKITGNGTENIDTAIACYELALAVYTREDFPEKWADTQNNLAIAYRNKITGNRGENIDRAIACYELALEVYTPEDFPENWAMTQNNLATAYSNKITGNRAENIDTAIACYELALAVYTSEDFPENWAGTQNNLANAYSNKITSNRAENIDRAIACYQKALAVYTREDFPENWAMTQNNLAAAYSNKITSNRAQNIDTAIACYDLALEVRTRKAFPFNNVETLNNLGWAYRAKLDQINLKTPVDTQQKTATLQSAYNTFKDAITGAENLRELIKSSDEIKQKHDVEWDGLYMGMVSVCLDRDLNQEALIYAETNKARNLAELIAQKQETPKTLKPITFAEITQLLTTDTALIEWYITNEEIITFVLTSPNVLTVYRSSKWDELIALVNEYREAYRESKTNWQNQLPSYLQRLAAILEITTILPAASQRLILIPHWFLHLFPLHALPLGDEQFLLDKFPQGIQYAPSCQLLQQIKIHPNFDQLLALQNPTLDLFFTDLEVTSIAPKFAIRQVIPGVEASKINLLGQYIKQLEDAHCVHFSCHGSFNAENPLNSFLALSGSLIKEEESQSSQHGDPPQPPLKRGEQEEDTPLKMGEQEEDIPLKTGEQEENIPLKTGEQEEDIPLKTGESEIVKVPLNKGDLGGSDRYVAWRDGKMADITKCLTLEEIFQLKLKQCRLVVLSACETALIDTESRSDYIGLPTGFIHAGAMGTLASLWAVNAISTALIMVKFYEALQPGVSIGQALHDTQLWFKSAYPSDLKKWVRGSSSFDDEQKKRILKELGGYNSNEKPYGKVYHWGAFCAIGL